MAFRINMRPVKITKRKRVSVKLPDDCWTDADWRDSPVKRDEGRLPPLSKKELEEKTREHLRYLARVRKGKA